MNGYRWKATFKMVPHNDVSALLHSRIFSRVEMQQANFMDHLGQYKGPDQELDDKVDIVAYAGHLHLYDLVGAMHERMVNSLWLKFKGIEAIGDAKG